MLDLDKVQKFICYCLLHRYLVANTFFIIHYCFSFLTFCFNMALRANTASPQRDNHPSLLPGLPLFWSDTTKSPAMEWKRWFDHFTVAVMVKNYISDEELTRTVDDENPRVKAIIGDMPEEAIQKFPFELSEHKKL